MAVLSLIETLEPRIAPAQILSTTAVQYTDWDGDSIIVESNKAMFTTESVDILFQFDKGSVDGTTTTKQALILLNLARLTSAADGLDLTIRVAAQGATGNGQAEVGFIRAGVTDSDRIWQAGIDLGNVNIQGDVLAIDAGDKYVDVAISALAVNSMGVLVANDPRTAHIGNTIPDLRSDIYGGAGLIHVSGDVARSEILASGVRYGDIGVLQIGGALGGISNTGTSGGGAVRFTGTLGYATIGNIVGGSQAASGLIYGEPDYGGDAGVITVLGSVIGGGGQNSGLILVQALSQLTIGGNLRGGAGETSGYVEVTHALPAAYIFGSIIGGSGESSGKLYVGETLTKFTLKGNLEGGSGELSGALEVSGRLVHGRIKGNIIGGVDGSGASVSLSGSVYANNINWLRVEGSISSGDVDSGELYGIAGNGSVIAEKVLGTLLVEGGVAGADNSPVVIAAGGKSSGNAIGLVDIRGSLSNAQVLAGWSQTGGSFTLTNSDVGIRTVKVSGHLIQTDIVAGAEPGDDGHFGSNDDTSGIDADGNSGLEGAFSRIGKVVVGGNVLNDLVFNYGIVAQKIAKVTIHGSPVPLTPSISNDVISAGPLGQLEGAGEYTIREVV